MIGHLAGAGLRANCVAEARASWTGSGAMIGDTPRICGIGLLHGRAVLADDDAAENRFAEDRFAEALAQTSARGRSSVPAC